MTQWVVRDLTTHCVISFMYYSIVSKCYWSISLASPELISLARALCEGYIAINWLILPLPYIYSLLGVSRLCEYIICKIQLSVYPAKSFEVVFEHVKIWSGFSFECTGQSIDLAPEAWSATKFISLALLSTYSLTSLESWLKTPFHFRWMLLDFFTLYLRFLYILILSLRHRVCDDNDRVPAEHLLQCDPGVGPALPVCVVYVRVAVVAL